MSRDELCCGTQEYLYSALSKRKMQTPSHCDLCQKQDLMFTRARCTKWGSVYVSWGKEFLMCSVSQVGLPHDADDLHDRNVLPARNSHRTSLEHLSVPFHTRDQRDLVSVCECVYCMNVDVWFRTLGILLEGGIHPKTRVNMQRYKDDWSWEDLNVCWFLTDCHQCYTSLMVLHILMWFLKSLFIFVNKSN